MRLLITGGAGFIGTNCALYFHKLGWNITIVDNFYRVGVQKNAVFLRNTLPNIQIIEADILHTQSYLTELKKTDVIIHLAGQTAVTTSLKDPLNDFTINVLGSFTLLEAVRIHNPKAIVIYSSTNKVYGDLSHHTLAKDEKTKKYLDTCHPAGILENEPLEFISPYGCSKGTIDMYMQDYYRSFGIKTVTFRQSCIYGPFQIGVEDQGWLAHFTKQFLYKKPITIFGDGYQVRDLLYIDDLLDLYKSSIDKIKTVQGKALNAGGGINNSYSLLNIIDILNKKIGEIPISFKKERLGDQKYFVSANQSALQLLAWHPTTMFEDGVTKLIQWQGEHLSE